METKNVTILHDDEMSICTKRGWERWLRIRDYCRENPKQASVTLEMHLGPYHLDDRRTSGLQ